MLKAKKRLTRREIKQDKLVTTYFKTLDFLSKFKREFTYGLVALIAVGALGFFVVNSKRSAEKKAAVEFARGKAAFDNGDFAAAIDVFTALTADFSGTKSAGWGNIYLGKANLKMNNFEAAEKYFRTYLDDYDADPLLSLAAATGIAASYDQRGDYAKAAQFYENAAKTYKASFKAPELLISAARCYRLSGQKDDARRVLQMVIADYPESQSVSDAKMYLSEISS